jgi:transposase
MEQGVTMTARDILRVDVVGRYLDEKVTAVEAASELTVSERQFRRYVSAYRMKGAIGLLHGNRGKPSHRRIPDSVRGQVQELMRSQYSEFNTSHIRDMLEEEHDISLSYSCVWRLRSEMKQATPKKHRPRTHRVRRIAAEREGQLVQVDGSTHVWLKDHGLSFTPISFLDDATGKILGGVFREAEDAVGYIQVLRQVCDTYGVPQALYADRHTIFQSTKKPTALQKARHEEPVTQFGAVLAGLGVRRIAAQSPQAKGRVERLFGTLQDRLVNELAHYQVANMVDANTFLPGFIRKFNARFQHDAADPTPAFSARPVGLSPQHVFACHYTRVVGNDNTVSFGELKLPIPPGDRRRTNTRAKVDLYLHYTGTLTIEYQGRRLVRYRHDPSTPSRLDHFLPAEPIQYSPTPAPEPAELPKRENAGTQATRPDEFHPWRRMPLNYDRS